MDNHNLRSIAQHGKALPRTPKIYSKTVSRLFQPTLITHPNHAVQHTGTARRQTRMKMLRDIMFDFNSISEIDAKWNFHSPKHYFVENILKGKLPHGIPKTQ